MKPSHKHALEKFTKERVSDDGHAHWDSEANDELHRESKRINSAWDLLPILGILLILAIIALLSGCEQKSASEAQLNEIDTASSIVLSSPPKNETSPIVVEKSLTEGTPTVSVESWHNDHLVSYEIIFENIDANGIQEGVIDIAFFVPDLTDSIIDIFKAKAQKEYDKHIKFCDK